MHNMISLKYLSEDKKKSGTKDLLGDLLKSQKLMKY